jgi:hypothetical protein
MPNVSVSVAVLTHPAKPLQLFFSFCLNEKFVSLFSASTLFEFGSRTTPYAAAVCYTSIRTVPISAAMAASIPNAIARFFV